LDFSLTKLNYLVTVAQAQSFSRAAELLDVSQPALSRAITELERDYGVRIFDRSRSGTLPTASGMQIITEAEELLQKARTFHHNSRLIAKGERGEVSFGLAPAIASSMLPELAQNLIAHHPGINLQTVIRTCDQLVDYLKSEAIEMFISPQEHVVLPAETETRVIGIARGGFYVRSGHPLCAGPKLTLAEIFEYPLVSARQSDLLSQVERHAGTIVCDNYALIHQILQDSDAVCIATQHSAASEIAAGRLTLLAPEDFSFQPSPVVVAKIAGRTISPVAREVVDYCEKWLARTE